MSDLAALPGTELPGSEFVVSAAEEERYQRIVEGPPAPAGTVDPLWGLIAALTGTGLGIGELFALADCDLERDGPLLGEFELELDRAIAPDAPLRVGARVESLDRKRGRSGVFDLMRVRVTLTGAAGEPVGRVLNTYVVPRDRPELGA